MKNTESFSDEQKGYFEAVSYRGPGDPVVKAYAQPKIEFICRHVSVKPETQFLDVGCGNGIFTVPFAKLSDNVLGIDTSENLLKENPHPNVRVGDATQLDLPDNSFDVAFEANILHHIADPEAAVREMVRVSRSHVILLEPNRYNPLMALFGLLVREERGLLKSSRGALEALLTRCGARVTAALVTGMITQNATPEFLLPVLRLFDRQIWWGEYIVLIAEKTTDRTP
jgi:2-polyprenyl-3-methyl-5-hydroxy-6-metoxy-1,4-benzoquinol methylase